MIELPLNKAIVAVLKDVKCNDECLDENYVCPIDCCIGCIFHETNPDYKSLESPMEDETCGYLACVRGNRKDGQSVIFRFAE